MMKNCINLLIDSFRKKLLSFWLWLAIADFKLIFTVNFFNQSQINFQIKEYRKHARY